jgi:putative transcriptional regulator
MSLAGKLLVATPKLDGSPFRQCVIFVGEHNRNGAKGYVLNRPTMVTVSKLFNHLGIETVANFPDKLYHGGPVNERCVYMVHTPEWYSSSTTHINTDFAASRDTFMFEKMSEFNMPEEWQMFAGQSTWSPGQLENEIDQDNWMTLAATPALVFASKKTQLWEIAVELCGQQMINNYF